MCLILTRSYMPEELRWRWAKVLVKVLGQLLQFHLGWVFGCLVGYLLQASDLAPSWLCLHSPTCRRGKKGVPGAEGWWLVLTGSGPTNTPDNDQITSKEMDSKAETVHFQYTKTTPSLHRRVWQLVTIVSEFCSTLIPTEEWGVFCASHCPASLMRATACLRNVRLNAIGEEEKPCSAGRKIEEKV